jgi:hypothetical protein
MKYYTTIEKWDDLFDGSAIYSLVDQNGKRYIGQAKNLQNRLDTHRRELNKAYQGRNVRINEGAKLIEAVKNGVRFRVDILKKFQWHEATVNNLRYWENYYLENYGGVDNTYNFAPIPYPVENFEDFNSVELVIDISADILEKLSEVDNMQGYIKSLIRADIAK